MDFFDRETAKVKINEFGRKKEPFLFIIDSDVKKVVMVSPESAKDKGILYDFNGTKNCSETPAGLPDLDFELFPSGFDKYLEAFSKVADHIRRGDTYLLNLTFPTPVRTNYSLRQIFLAARAPYKLLFRDEFVVFSPETFVTIKDGYISGFPMKGTIDASFPEAEQIILKDKKEFCEHNTIVDLIRNDLSMIATGIKVNRFRYIDRVKTNRNELLQVSSEITGVLPEDWQVQLGDILLTLLPAGSVTGAPKEKTVEIIRAAEPCSRGFYTGICGIYDGSSLDSAVMIRFMEKTPDGLFFRSGGGITCMSDPEVEYREMIDKVYVPAV